MSSSATIHGVIKAAIQAREEKGKIYNFPRAILWRFADGSWPRAKRESRKLMDRIEEDLVFYEEATGQYWPHGKSSCG